MLTWLIASAALNGLLVIAWLRERAYRKDAEDRASEAVIERARAELSLRAGSGRHTKVAREFTGPTIAEILDGKRRPRGVARTDIPGGDAA